MCIAVGGHDDMKEMKFINKRAVKDIAMELADKRWGKGRMTRVSDSFLHRVNASVGLLIMQMVNDHIDHGKTLK
jgi:hypothetical protein